MSHPILTAIHRASFTPLGWFAPRVEDGVPHNAAFVILIGNTGPDMFRRFARERDPSRDSMDQWTEDAVGQLARDIDAAALFPFRADPPYPFLTWARRAGAGHVSPLGLNIHPTYGLWHAYRAALLFPGAFDLPHSAPGPHPCDTCVDKPCLTTCPVQAFDGARYDVNSCARHIATPQGSDCMSRGCLARHACPVGQVYAYQPAQAQFHMNAFLGARQRNGN